MGAYEYQIPPGVNIPADFNNDCDVDQEDFDIFKSCSSGPAIPHNGSETCQRADFDDDNDVDQEDFGIFQRCYSGSGNPADPNCTNWADIAAGRTGDLGHLSVLMPCFSGISQ